MSGDRDELEQAHLSAMDAAERYGIKFGRQDMTLIGGGTVEFFDAARRLMDEAMASGEPTSDAALYEALGADPPPADAVI